MAPRKFRQQELVFSNLGKVELRSRNTEFALAPFDVLLETKLSVVSAGTEIALLRGDGEAMHGRTFPICPSTAIIGQVVDLGSTIAEIRHDLAVGAQLIVTARHSAFVRVSAQRDDICVLNYDLPDEIAILARLAGVAAHAIHVGLADDSKSVLVLGLGLVGQLALRAASVAGCRSLVAIDPHANRRESAAKVLGTSVFDRTDELPSADIVLVACADSAAIENGLAAANDGGTLVLVGAGIDPVTLDIARHVFRRGVRILGAHQRFFDTAIPVAATPIVQGLRLLCDPSFCAEGLILERVPARRLASVYNRGLSEKDRYVGVIVDWGAD